MKIVLEETSLWNCSGRKKRLTQKIQKSRGFETEKRSVRNFNMKLLWL
jgi:hypothetical protein